MGEARYCIKCRKADNGEGSWKSHHEWTDDFLSMAAKEIVKQGKVRRIICDPCQEGIRSRGHNVINGGQK